MTARQTFENFIFYPPVMKARTLVDAGAIDTPLVDPAWPAPVTTR